MCNMINDAQLLIIVAYLKNETLKTQIIKE